MPSYVTAAIVLSYVSLVVELTVLHVPSVASSLRIWSADPGVVSHYSPRYLELFALGPTRKVIRFGLPLLVTYAVYLFPLLVLFGGLDPLGDYVFEPSSGTSVAAVTAIAVGRVVALWTAWTLRKSGSKLGDSSFLHTSGAFRMSRNPGLVGMYVFVAGLWIAAPSASMSIGILVYMIYMDFKVRMEEDFLQNKFGDAYLDYQARTARYLL